MSSSAEGAWWNNGMIISYFTLINTATEASRNRILVWTDFLTFKWVIGDDECDTKLNLFYFYIENYFTQMLQAIHIALNDENSLLIKSDLSIHKCIPPLEAKHLSWGNKLHQCVSDTTAKGSGSPSIMHPYFQRYINPDLEIRISMSILGIQICSLP